MTISTNSLSLSVSLSEGFTAISFFPGKVFLHDSEVVPARLILVFQTSFDETTASKSSCLFP